jgi:DNA-binding transcriptional MocR family regulator
VIARGPAAHRLRAGQLVESFFVAGPLQETAMEFTGSPAWRRHLSYVAGELDARRAALADALATLLPQARLPLMPGGGMHLWVRLPPGTPEAALVEEARRNGVAVSPGRLYHPSEPPAPYLRISHTGVTHVPELAEGVRRLATAFRRTTP